MKARTVENAQNTSSNSVSPKAESFAERVARICGNADSSGDTVSSDKDIVEVSAFSNWNNFSNF